MGFKLPNNVLQLSATAGTSAYTFASVVSGYAAFSTQLSNGDTAPYFARDANSWEVGLGTWASGPGTLARTLIVSSTGSLISWPGTGTREVGCGLPGAWLLQMLDPSATPGLLVRGSSIGSWLTRTIVDGNFVLIDNPDGVSGPPTINDSFLPDSFPRRDTGQASDIVALWSFINRIIFDGFTGSPSVQDVRGQDDELMLRWRRGGANEYTAEMRQSASWRRLITATAADLNDANLLGGFDPTAAANYNFANPGHVVIPVGSNLSSSRLIVNFGSNSVAGTGTDDITLSKAYPNGHLQAYASYDIGGGGDANAEAGPGTTALTQIQIHNPVGATRTIRWLSIGY